jgi:hypothetical protein
VLDLPFLSRAANTVPMPHRLIYGQPAVRQAENDLKGRDWLTGGVSASGWNHHYHGEIWFSDIG